MKNKLANIKTLEIVARRLDHLLESVVCLGGCTTGLLITDDAIPDIRMSMDVDCIVDILSLSDHYKLQEELKNLGFEQSPLETDHICRWYVEGVAVDIMPTKDSILGFGNKWYQEAAQNAQVLKIKNDLNLKLVTAPYFLATKLEAFRGRGNDDYLASHDLEDIISVVDGREELLQELSEASTDVRSYISEVVSKFLKTRKFMDALPGHVSYSGLAEDRVAIIIERLEQISALE